MILYLSLYPQVIYYDWQEWVNKLTTKFKYKCLFLNFCYIIVLQDKKNPVWLFTILYEWYMDKNIYFSI